MVKRLFYADREDGGSNPSKCKKNIELLESVENNVNLFSKTVELFPNPIKLFFCEFRKFDQKSRNIQVQLNFNFEEPK